MQKSLFALSFLVAAACSSTSSARPILVPAPVAVPSLAAQENVVQLAQRRAQLIGWLHDYREAGVFPADAAGKPASVFMDASGVRCPMAELLHKSGRDDLVAAVTNEANGVRLIDVTSGPLHDWMLSSGLTRDEINLVQGAMNISFDWMEIENPELPQEHILAGKAAVRAKLEVAEMALRDNTAASLTAVVARLPAKATLAQLASSPVSGAVVPAAAIPKPVALRIVPQAQRRVVLRRAYPQFQIGN
ncbi:MAG: hypothetical protein JNL83_12240 [Myxococcales bacterium]|nr:hypothetical protein [Myxococcales bacterium]